ncbi:hypothetical protein DPMN_072133 [Dreissena polymorpha]|uniref:Uncharacterized protein n=1 Tax=Dreissena polymorpha TaxID=45954 RepID=A0A9D3Z3I5_DREPO|nr:hypothetical protein DPMN_072133 [Dreissena polymorpha]
MQRNGSFVSVPSDALTGDIIDDIHINQELNVTFGEGKGNTNLQNFSNHFLDETNTVDVEHDCYKCLTKQGQRENFNDPKD